MMSYFLFLKKILISRTDQNRRKIRTPPGTLRSVWELTMSDLQIMTGLCCLRLVTKELKVSFSADPVILELEL